MPSLKPFVLLLQLVLGLRSRANDGLAGGPNAESDNDGVSDKQESKAKHTPKKLDKKRP
jgi:hypothetical protein